MAWLPAAINAGSAIAGLLFGGKETHTHEVHHHPPDPALRAALENMEAKNKQLEKEYAAIVEQMQDMEIDSYEDLEKHDKKAAEALVNLAKDTKGVPMQGRNFGFFGITSTGKSTMINTLVGKDVAETVEGETTVCIQRYDGPGLTVHEIQGRNDDVSYFSAIYVSFWKSLTGRIVLINATVKEMTKVLTLLDAISLTYDLVVNKFDVVPKEEREKLKVKIRAEAQKLKGVQHIWFVSSTNPQMFKEDWMQMVDHLTN